MLFSWLSFPWYKSKITGDCCFVFKFLQRSVDGKHLMCFQIGTSVFEFLLCRNLTLKKSETSKAVKMNYWLMNPDYHSWLSTPSDTIFIFFIAFLQWFISMHHGLHSVRRWMMLWQNWQQRTLMWNFIRYLGLLCMNRLYVVTINSNWMRLSYNIVSSEQINNNYYFPKSRQRQIIDQLDTDKLWYYMITKFNNCFIIWSLSLFSY